MGEEPLDSMQNYHSACKWVQSIWFSRSSYSLQMFSVLHNHSSSESGLLYYLSTACLSCCWRPDHSCSKCNELLNPCLEREQVHRLVPGRELVALCWQSSGSARVVTVFAGHSNTGLSMMASINSKLGLILTDNAFPSITLLPLYAPSQKFSILVTQEAILTQGLTPE